MVVSPVGDHKIGAFICYESVFPNFVRRFAAGGAQVLFTISNDGWFGKTAARWQHLEIVRMRAAENRRWILRAANDGITAAIDPAGRVRSTLPLFVEATSSRPFQLRNHPDVLHPPRRLVPRAVRVAGGRVPGSGKTHAGLSGAWWGMLLACQRPLAGAPPRANSGGHGSDAESGSSRAKDCSSAAWSSGIREDATFQTSSRSTPI